MTSEIKCVHSIELDNLKSGEVVIHSILLIRGHTISIPGCSSGAPAKKCTAQQIRLRLRNQLSSGAEEDQHNWQQLEVQIARNGQFKLLCDLQQFEDVARPFDTAIPLCLELNFCNCERSWQLIYDLRQKSGHRLQSLYIACQGATADENSIQEACEKIALNLRIVQSVYAELLRVAGFGRRTFVLSQNCEIFRSALTCEEAWRHNENDLWQIFAKELLNSPLYGNDDDVKFVAFIGCTKYDNAGVIDSADFSYVNIRRHLKAHAALGGGGLALFGTAHFYAWPRYFHEAIECFRNDKSVNVAEQPDDSNYRCTYGGVYATTLGSVVHEIGHIFDLGHTNDGVMGNGFDYINRLFTVDNLTENLPDRIIHRNTLEPAREPPTRPRFTQLRKTTNSFLNKYHEQKESDCFYFTRNCEIILTHHRWFNDNENARINETATITPKITYCHDSGYVISEENAHPLRLIEVRSSGNSLVKHWYELQANPNRASNCRFQLPEEALAALQQNHYLFAMTETGYTQRLCEA